MRRFLFLALRSFGRPPFDLAIQLPPPLHSRRSTIRLRLSAMLGFSLETLSNASRTKVGLNCFRTFVLYVVRWLVCRLAHFAANTASCSMTRRMLTRASMSSASWLHLNSVLLSLTHTHTHTLAYGNSI
jgi:hypothetical protein